MPAMPWCRRAFCALFTTITWRLLGGGGSACAFTSTTFVFDANAGIVRQRLRSPILRVLDICTSAHVWCNVWAVNKTFQMNGLCERRQSTLCFTDRPVGPFLAVDSAMANDEKGATEDEGGKI